MTGVGINRNTKLLHSGVLWMVSPYYVALDALGGVGYDSRKFLVGHKSGVSLSFELR